MACGQRPYLHHLRKYLTVEHGDRAMECMLRTRAVSMFGVGGVAELPVALKALPGAELSDSLA